MMKHHQFMAMARIVAESSKCVSLKVGALIVRDGRIISTGYNGTPQGWKNCCDVHRERGFEHTEWSLKFEIHAEMNAIVFAARNGVSIADTTMYTTIEPCFSCVKVLVQSGIKRVIYDGGYYREGEINLQVEKLEFAESCKLEIVKLDSLLSG